jgi:hypothetical protein
LEKKSEKTIQLDVSISMGGPRSENNSGGSDISPEGARASQPYRCIQLNGFFTLFLQTTSLLEECNNNMTRNLKRFCYRKWTFRIMSSLPIQLICVGISGTEQDVCNF